VAAFALAFLAGVLSTLSPCVLPLLPIVLGAAGSEHRLGPAALAAGLTLSFAAIGLFVAALGFAIGLDAGAFQIAAAVLMIAIGMVLIVPGFQARLALAGGPAAGWVERRFGGFSAGGLHGQFAVGLLLGAVWSPCVGPTLGAASVLAAQKQDLARVAATMLLFGLGASVPLLLLGVLSREVLRRARERLLATGRAAKTALGVLLIVGRGSGCHRARQANRDGPGRGRAAMADRPHDAALSKPDEPHEDAGDAAGTGGAGRRGIHPPIAWSPQFTGR
jgi:cytochrome c-type biogenesis protein